MNDFVLTSAKLALGLRIAPRFELDALAHGKQRCNGAEDFGCGFARKNASDFNDAGAQRENINIIRETYKKLLHTKNGNQRCNGAEHF
jgi:hypothetical protein